MSIYIAACDCYSLCMFVTVSTREKFFKVMVGGLYTLFLTLIITYVRHVFVCVCSYLGHTRCGQLIFVTTHIANLPLLLLLELTETRNLENTFSRYSPRNWNHNIPTTTRSSTVVTL